MDDSVDPAVSDLSVRAKTLADEATPGPWGIIHGAPGKMHAIWWGDPSSGALAYIGNEVSHQGADAAFIAASRELVPALAAEVERLEAAREQLVAALRGLLEAWDITQRSGVGVLNPEWKTNIVGGARAALASLEDSPHD